jgi:hypothetical protein
MKWPYEVAMSPAAAGDSGAGAYSKRRFLLGAAGSSVFLLEFLAMRISPP